MTAVPVGARWLPAVVSLALASALASACSAPVVTGPQGSTRAEESAGGSKTDARVDPERTDAADPQIVAPARLDAESDLGPQTSTSACPGVDVPTPIPCAGQGVVIAPEYAPHYTCFDLGPVPGVPMQKYGGLTLTEDACSTKLLIGGQANAPGGKLYGVTVRRDRTGHISGFDGTATVVADAPFNDGGITFGPGGVLFFARWPRNELQQTKPGSTTADKVIPLMPLGVAYASASLGFVPANLPGAGSFKLMSWSQGQWYTLAFAPDGMGTYNVTAAKPGVNLDGGPEGFVYVAAGSPMFSKHSLLVSEWSDNGIATYEIDEAGDPIVATRKTFMTGFRGAEGAYRDPATGDFFFSTWGQAADRVIVVRGFRPITID